MSRRACSNWKPRGRLDHRLQQVMRRLGLAQGGELPLRPRPPFDHAGALHRRRRRVLPRRGTDNSRRGSPAAGEGSSPAGAANTRSPCAGSGEDLRRQRAVAERAEVVGHQAQAARPEPEREAGLPRARLADQQAGASRGRHRPGVEHPAVAGARQGLVDHAVLQVELKGSPRSQRVRPSVSARLVSLRLHRQLDVSPAPCPPGKAAQQGVEIAPRRLRRAVDVECRTEQNPTRIPGAHCKIWINFRVSRSPRNLRSAFSSMESCGKIWPNSCRIMLNVC